MAEAASNEKVLVELPRKVAFDFAHGRYEPFQRAKRAVKSAMKDALDSTPQQFDLSSFRKKLRSRLEASRNRGMKAGALGHDEDHCYEQGACAELEAVLALLPAEEE